MNGSSAGRKRELEARLRDPLPLRAPGELRLDPGSRETPAERAEVGGRPDGRERTFSGRPHAIGPITSHHVTVAASLGVS